jgi:HNH endonuclease
MRLDPKTGRFLPTPKGTKTPKMIALEERLGRSLEKDYEEHYIKENYGQKRMASRWGVKRTTLFGIYKAGRRSWVQMLNLPVRRHSSAPTNPDVPHTTSHRCDACGREHVSLDSAHWVSREDGGKKAFYNLLSLCPNCHRLLDRGDRFTVQICGESLLIKSIKKLLGDAERTQQGRHRLFHIVEAIVKRIPV